MSKAFEFVSLKEAESKKMEIIKSGLEIRESWGRTVYPAHMIKKITIRKIAKK
ncbi:MAG: hypothetical protein WBC20_01360 [Candidatus Aminicenantaceae bacterium]